MFILSAQAFLTSHQQAYICGTEKAELISKTDILGTISQTQESA